MHWKPFLKPTLGKFLLTLFFILVPVPLSSQLISVFKAKYVPILLFPFVATSTVYAYIALILIIICFYILASLLSHLYHKYVLADARR